MPKYVVYEIWTRARVVEAENLSDAYNVGEPTKRGVVGLGLSNWHVVRMADTPEPPTSRGLNYRQVE